MRVDWPQLLEDIAYLLGDPSRENPNVRIPAGASAVAAYLSFERGTVRGWMSGQTPRHHDGEILIARWTRITGKHRDFVPMCKPVLSARTAR